MLIARDAWQALGGFDPRFFLYAEELDLCRRAAAGGWRTGLVPGARIFHDVGSGAPRSPARLVLQMRGIATYYRKHLNVLEARLCLLLHWLGCIERLAVAGLRAPFDRRQAMAARAFARVALCPQRWVGGYPASGGRAP